MSEIVILKGGLSDYETCVKKIEDTFIELEKKENRLRTTIAEKDWQGLTRDRCEIIFNLTTTYKNKIKEILYDMNKLEADLKQNLTDFTLISSVVKSL